MAQKTPPGPSAPSSGPEPHRWLLFVHQLPPKPTNLRVRTWRRLQQIGALPVRQALYVLPDTSVAREDFEWLKAEIEGAGGQASLFTASAVDAWSNEALVEEFRRSRDADYEALARDVTHLLAGTSGATTSTRRALQQLKDRFTAIDRIDFFGSAGRERASTLLAQAEARGRAGAPARAGLAADARRYRNRLWVTRPRPGIDRLASAWLIRRFIDPEARFTFAADRDAVPSNGVPFDMFGVEFGHRGAHCTFETLCAEFELSDSALVHLARVVHDLDFKDGRFGVADAPTMGLLVDGLQLTQADDESLLAEGITLFEALYRALLHAPAARARKGAKTTPRPAAKAARVAGKGKSGARRT